MYLYLFLGLQKERKWQQALRQSLLIWLPYLIMLVSLFVFGDWQYTPHKFKVRCQMIQSLKQLFLEPGNNLLVLLTRNN